MLIGKIKNTFTTQPVVGEILSYSHDIPLNGFIRVSGSVSLWVTLEDKLAGLQPFTSVTFEFPATEEFTKAEIEETLAGSSIYNDTFKDAVVHV